MANESTHPTAEKAAEAPTAEVVSSETVFSAKDVLTSCVDETTVKQAVRGWE